MGSQSVPRPLRKRQGPSSAITKDAIFHYVYGVLHDPIYHEKYALDLKREFPRIPFYPDFWRWAEWGEALLALHIGYETVEPWPLERIDTPDGKRKRPVAPKALLKADKSAGNIQLDSETQLTGFPAEAWTYQLGNRSALEWVLDQHKEKTPKDPTIRERFNAYRFRGSQGEGHRPPEARHPRQRRDDADCRGDAQRSALTARGLAQPADLVERVPEVVPGYPDRILPVDERAATILKKRTLTNLYNERPAWLDHAHRDLDAAVAAAYGWPADLPDEQILERLFQLNQARAAAQ